MEQFEEGFERHETDSLGLANLSMILPACFDRKACIFKHVKYICWK